MNSYSGRALDATLRMAIKPKVMARVVADLLARVKAENRYVIYDEPAEKFAPDGTRNELVRHVVDREIYERYLKWCEEIERERIEMANDPAAPRGGRLHHRLRRGLAT